MRRDRAALVRLSAQALCVVLTVSALLATTPTSNATADEPSRHASSTRPTPRAEVFRAHTSTHAATNRKTTRPVARRSAAITGTAQISGVVTSPASDPIKSVGVFAYLWDSAAGSWVSANHDYTTPDGSYVLTSLPAGRYRIAFDVDDGSEYESEYWDNAGSFQAADDLQLTDGQTVTGTNAQLAEKGRITGKVTSPDGKPLANIQVVAYTADDSDDWYPYADTLTGAGGGYDLGPLPRGPYRILFWDAIGGFIEEFWRDAETLDSATTIQVTPGTVRTGTNAQLARGAAIQGVVTSVNGASPEDVEVRAYHWNADTKAWDWLYYTTTTSGGHYDMFGLRTGKWRIGFAAEDDTYYAQYWDGSRTLAGATTISTVAGKKYPGHDARLSEPAVITGTVTNADGSPADANIWVYAWDAGRDEWYPYNNEYTDGDGSYWSGGLEPGSYLLKFDDNEGFGSEYWDDALTSTTAVELRVEDNDDITDADVQFADGSLPDIMNTRRPVATGSARVGQALTATEGTWSPAGELTVTYRWYADGVRVPGATAATYVPKPTDVGKALQVQVRASTPGYNPTAAASSAGRVSAGILGAVTKPKVTGKAKKNATLTVSPGAWSPSKVTTKIQWYAGAKAIPRATAARLKLAGKTLKAVARKAISVVVTVTAPGYSTVITRLKVPGKV